MNQSINIEQKNQNSLSDRITRVQSIASTITQEELKEKNRDIIVIGCGKPNGIDSFSQSTGFPGEKIFVDQQLNAYQLLKLKKAQKMSEIAGNTVNKDTKTGFLAGICWSIGQYCKLGSQGDVYQLGGAFLVDSGYNIIWTQTDNSSQDHMSAIEIRNLLDL